MKIRLFLLAGVLFLFASIQVNAQTPDDPVVNKVKYNTWSVYLGGGWFNYYGDISRANFYPGSTSDEKFSWDVMIGVNKTLNPIFGINANVVYGNIYSQKQEKYDKFLEATVLHYNLDATVSLSNLFFPKVYSKKYNVYMLLGLGNAHYRSLVTRSNGDFYACVGYENAGLTEQDVTEPGAETDMHTEASFNYGLGVKFRVTSRIAVGLEAAIHQLQSDEFDGVNRTLSEHDKIGHTNLLVQYTFGKNEVSNEWNPIDPLLAEILKRIKAVEKEVDTLQDDLDKVEDDVQILMDDYEKRMDKTDDDGDGVPNWLDIEPNTEPGAIVNWQGVALPIEKDKYERDADGSFTIVNGNPVLKEVPKKAETKILFSVFFALNSTYVTTINHERIAIAANMLKKYPDLNYEIIGEACKIGSDGYNEDLSKRRANVVKDILINEYGIDASRLKVTWDGELAPLNNKRLFINRRVDIVIAK